MNPTAKLLRHYNAWRRWGADGQPGPAMPDPREIGEAIDRAIELIEQRDALLAALTAARACIQIDRDILVECETHPTTGDVMPAAQAAIDDYDATLSTIDGAIAPACEGCANRTKEHTA